MPGRLRAAGRRPGRDTVTSPVIVVMGVSGCGKSTVGAALARALGIEFVEGDAFHPPENVARMAAGTPLTDEDRAGWLRTLAAHIAQAAPRGVVVSCSALKRSYRDVLRTGSAALRFASTPPEPGSRLRVAQWRSLVRRGCRRALRRASSPAIVLPPDASTYPGSWASTAASPATVMPASLSSTASTAATRYPQAAALRVCMCRTRLWST